MELQEPTNASGQTSPNGGQTIIINQTTPAKRNGIGLAGFILSLLSLLLFWFPVLDWILLILGLIFSFIGIFKTPRGFAIAGLAISFCSLIITLLFTLGIATIIGSMAM